MNLYVESMTFSSAYDEEYYHEVYIPYIQRLHEENDESDDDYTSQSSTKKTKKQINKENRKEILIDYEPIDGLSDTDKRKLGLTTKTFMNRKVKNDFYSFIKMDFDKSLDDKCSFCGESIKLTPVECICNKCKFCDIACAKLYYDNVERVKIDMKKYNMYYSNNQLSPTAKTIYEKMNSVMFDMLPICKINVEDNISEMKMKYMKLLMMMRKPGEK